MNYIDVTGRYYDAWIGAEGIFSSGGGADVVYSEERNRKQYGYSKCFDVFALLRTGRCVVSYGARAADRIGLLGELSGDMSAAELKDEIERVYGVRPAHSVKFVLDELTDVRNVARALCTDDRAAYIEFFKGMHPNADAGWIYEYFDEMAETGTTFGVFADGKLVSCADAPGMPFMVDKVQEIGIATLPEYRGKGYALDACVTAARAHIDGGKCPLWSAAWDNAASRNLAEKVGFEKYADAIMITLE